MNKKIILLVVSAVCIALYFCGSKIKKDNQFIKLLPIVGGLAFGLNTLINLAQSEKEEEPVLINHKKAQF